MVATRSKGRAGSVEHQGKKRSSAQTQPTPSKKTKTTKEKDGKLEVGDNGEVGLEEEDKKGEEEDGPEDAKTSDQGAVKGEVETGHAGPADEEVKDEEKKAEEDEQEKQSQREGEYSKGELQEPQHGTLESGHIYFLYRPKIEIEEPEGIDDVSKFHILLIPKSSPHDNGHYHRIIEVGKKKMPDPGAKHQVIWGLVTSVGNDQSTLKESFGAYTYETKTRGTRHQGAARPAARGHYILHSPNDLLADDPSKNRQRDFKMLLAYEITTPASDDFGRVQEELGLAPSGVVALQVKEPSAQSRNNPRAAGIPKEKRAQYPPKLMDLFHGRRFIPCNPPAFLSYTGTEILIISSAHRLSDALGEDGEKIEEDLERNAEDEAVGVQEAINELGLSKGDTEIEALEGAWA